MNNLKSLNIFAPTREKKSFGICYWCGKLLFSSGADMEDYGFEYSEEEPEEQDVDIENQYYDSKGNFQLVQWMKSILHHLKVPFWCFKF